MILEVKRGIRSFFLYLSLLEQDDDLYGENRTDSTTAEGHVISGLPNHVDKVLQLPLPNMEWNHSLSYTPEKSRKLERGQKYNKFITTIRIYVYIK